MFAMKMVPLFLAMPPNICHLIRNVVLLQMYAIFALYYRFLTDVVKVPQHSVLLHYLGAFDRECPYCHALHWAVEAVRLEEYGDCCQHRKVTVPFLHPLPNDLDILYCSSGCCGKEFHAHIRQYNKVFTFISTGGPGHINGICSRVADYACNLRKFRQHFAAFTCA